MTTDTITSPWSLTCSKCCRVAAILINGRCCNCDPFRVCKKCGTGTYVSSPTPDWMNRFICDNCGHKCSR